MYDIESKIQEAARKRQIIIITYKDKKGITSQRETEPYEIKDNCYWGYCISSDGIRRFNLDNILEARITNKNYTPRWDIKI